MKKWQIIIATMCIVPCAWAQTPADPEAPSAAAAGLVGDLTGMLNAPAGTSPLEAIAKASALPPAPPAASPNELEAEVEETMKKPMKEKQRVALSIFFTQDEIKKLRLAMDSYQERGETEAPTSQVTKFDDEDFLDTLIGIQNNLPKNRPFTYPQFFLESMVYHSASDWIIWLNNWKITPTTMQTNSNLKVVHIDPNRVTLQWRPADMDRVLTVWADSPPNDQVSVDDKNGLVEFKLHANQTFSSYSMRVLEGKVLPVTVKPTDSKLLAPLKSGQRAPAGNQKNVPNAEVTPQEEGDGHDKGLRGLLGAYDRLGDMKP